MTTITVRVGEAPSASTAGRVRVAVDDILVTRRVSEAPAANNTVRVVSLPAATLASISRRISYLAAPVLDWDDETDDATPDFTIDIDEDAVGLLVLSSRCRSGRDCLPIR